MTIHTARIDYKYTAEEFWYAFCENLEVLDQSCTLCRRCRELLDYDVTTFDSEFDYQSFVGYVSPFVGWGSGPDHARYPIIFVESSEDQGDDEDDSCMTPSEADKLLETWNSQKPQLFVLLMREDGRWSETAYGETCVSSDEDDMQKTVNDLCKNCRDFRGARFGYSSYPYEFSNIVERLFDEHSYDAE